MPVLKILCRTSVRSLRPEIFFRRLRLPDEQDGFVTAAAGERRQKPRAQKSKVR
jgi:hypothetical protein